MAAQTNRQFRLKQQPVGRAKSTDFDFAEAQMPTARSGEAIVQTLYLSIDRSDQQNLDERHGAVHAAGCDR